MELNKFNKATHLTERIYQLKLLKNYLESFLNKKPFSINVYGGVLGHEFNYPTVSINEAEAELYKLAEQTDVDHIIKSIQWRINELEVEFKQL